MPEWLVAFSKTDFGANAALCSAIVAISVVPFCIYKKQWPDLGSFVMMGLSSAGVSSGVKIAVLTLCLPAAQLGPLADDKAALMIGGLATMVLSLREAVGSWRKCTGI